jgi:hypothetical protein
VVSFALFIPQKYDTQFWEREREKMKKKFILQTLFLRIVRLSRVRYFVVKTVKTEKTALLTHFVSPPGKQSQPFFKIKTSL